MDGYIAPTRARGGRLQSWLGRHPRLALAGDACLLSSAAFGSVTALLALVLGEGEPGAWAALILAVLTFGSVLAGPMVPWLLRGRRIRLMAALGGLAAMVAIVFATQVLAAIAMGLAWLLQPLTSQQYAGPIALLVIATLAYLALLAMPVMGIAAGLGTRQVRGASYALFLMRVVAFALMLVFAAGSADPSGPGNGMDIDTR